MINFFIKQNSTSPELIYSVSAELFKKYSLSEEMLNYGVATFSMFNLKEETYAVANVPAEFIINTDILKISNEGKYVLKYRFTEDDTSEVGDFWGEFKLDILHPQYQPKLTLPTSDKIFIHVTPSITKTTVIR